MRKIAVLVLVIFLMGMILSFSSQSGGQSNGLSYKVANRIMDYMVLQGDDSLSLKNVNLIVRKLAHFSEYLLIGVLLAVALTNLLERAWLAVPLAGIMGVAFAFCDEWVQGSSPGRTQSIFDVMVDSVGVFVGLAAFSIVVLGIKRTLVVRALNQKK